MEREEHIYNLKELYYFINVSIPNNTYPNPVKRSEILARNIKIHFENFDDFPQNLFFVYVDGYQIFGRKYLPDHTIRNIINTYEIPETLEVCQKLSDRNFNEINADMLIGIYKKEQITANGIIIYYYPLTCNEKLYIFKKIRNDCNSDLYYPFPKLTKNYEEVIADQNYWNKMAENIDFLDKDEQCLRNQILNFLSQHDVTNKSIYDPACSSGKMLAIIKNSFPSCITIGQDINDLMINQAKNRVDIVINGDARNDYIPIESVDFIIIRFLNYGVLSTENAYALFPMIANRCKINGYIILIGHSPILLHIEFLEFIGVKILQKIAYCKKHNSIFQFYILKKIKGIHSIHYLNL